MRVVWINGPFGVGKSTVAEALVGGWPDAILYDPELIGPLVRGLLPPPLNEGDYQDIPLWRRLVQITAIELMSLYQRPLVVPMTLVVPAYFEEIVGGLRREGVQVDHFTLVARDETILARVPAQTVRSGRSPSFRAVSWDSAIRCSSVTWTRTRLTLTPSRTQSPRSSALPADDLRSDRRDPRPPECLPESRKQTRSA